MNPTPVFVQITAEPAAQNGLPLVLVLAAIVATVWFAHFAQKYLTWKRRRDERLALKRHEAEIEARHRFIDESFLKHLPESASNYHRERMRLHLACIRSGRTDLIVIGRNDQIVSWNREALV